MGTRDQGSRGMQFEVVVDGDFVQKTLHTVERSAAIYRSYGYGLINRDLSKLASDALDHAKSSLEGVRGVLESYPELAPTFANPVIDENLNYRQDKVMVMGTALRQVARTPDVSILMSTLICCYFMLATAHQ